MAKIKKTGLVTAVVVFVVVICVVLYLRPVGNVMATVPKLESIPAQTVNLPWPSYGQSAVGAVGYGVLASQNTAKPAPTASIAKIMTALAVLDKKPLATGQQGPMITITDGDMGTYQNFAAQGQSVAAVKVGEQISEYQALQAMLIPSANNFAVLLANWAFGSEDQYTAYVNQKATDLNLKNSHFADASGFSSATTSTASDLIILGEQAYRNPVIYSIVSQPQAVIPVAGIIKNVNWLLGNSGIDGIKTGNSDQAGGCYLLSAKRTIQGQSTETLVAVMNAPNLTAAITSAKGLLVASDAGFNKVTLASANNPIAEYDTKWNAKAGAATNGDFSILAWRGLPTKVAANFNDLKPRAPKGTHVGILTAQNGKFYQTDHLFLDQNLPKPNLWWRIFH